MNIDHSGPDHLPPVIGEAGQQVLLVVAEAVGDEEDGAPLRLLSVGRLLVLLTREGEHKRRGVEVLHQLWFLLDPLENDVGEGIISYWMPKMMIMMLMTMVMIMTVFGYLEVALSRACWSEASESFC